MSKPLTQDAKRMLTFEERLQLASESIKAKVAAQPKATRNATRARLWVRLISSNLLVDSKAVLS